MKKLSLLIALAAALCLPANAQEAFKHLSFGLELGTTGIGAELSLPVLTDHLVLKAGATFPNITLEYKNPKLDISGLSNKANAYIANANNYLSSSHGEKDMFTSLPNTTALNASGEFNFTSFKAILEYYPSKNSSFHINAGIYAGSRQFASADGDVKELWSTYEADIRLAESYCEKYPDFKKYIGEIPDLSANIRGKTYQVKSPGNMNIDLAIAAVRPYLGFGFGRSVPKTRCGFQFDLGAIYLGKCSYSSTNEITYDPSAQNITIDDTVENIINFFENGGIYPVMNFRFIVRLF